MCICVLVYLYLGNKEVVVVGEWVVDVISFQKIFGLCGLECYVVEIWRDVTLIHGRRTTEHEDSSRNLEAEFAIDFSSSGLIEVKTRRLKDEIYEISFY